MVQGKSSRQLKITKAMSKNGVNSKSFFLCYIVWGYHLLGQCSTITVPFSRIEWECLQSQGPGPPLSHFIKLLYFSNWQCINYYTIQMDFSSNIENCFEETLFQLDFLKVSRKFGRELKMNFKHTKKPVKKSKVLNTQLYVLRQLTYIEGSLW